MEMFQRNDRSFRELFISFRNNSLKLLGKACLRSLLYSTKYFMPKFFSNTGPSEGWLRKKQKRQLELGLKERVGKRGLAA
jgi:hypothetical protein